MNKNSTSLAGEYAVLSQLHLLEFEAALTLGNTKGVDILVSNPKNGNMFRLEVKTTIKKQVNNRYSWIMNEKHEEIKDPKLFYCFVHISEEKIFSFFIVPSIVVAKFVKSDFKKWADGIARRQKEQMRKFFLPLDQKPNWELLK